MAVGTVPDPGFNYGIDVELADPRRDWQGIIAAFGLSPGRSVSPAIGAALWCFGEACFKASGEIPGRQLLQNVLDLAFEGHDEITVTARFAERHLLAHGGKVEGADDFRLFHVVIGRDAIRAGARLDLSDYRG